MAGKTGELILGANEIPSVIRVKLFALNITVKPSADGLCRAEAMGKGADRIEFGFDNGALTISEISGGAFGGAGKIYLSLPEVRYADVKIESDSGDVDISSLKAQRAYVTTLSGDVSVNDISAELFSASGESGDFEGRGLFAQTIDLRFLSGDTELSRAGAENALTIDSGSGDVRISETEGNKLKLESSGGDVKAINSSFKESFFIRTYSGDAEIKLSGASGLVKSTSGDIRFLGAAENLLLESTSGDIRALGDFLSVRISSVSGDIGLTAKQPNVETIEASTVSGDIDIWCSEQAEKRVKARSQSGDVRKH